MPSSYLLFKYTTKMAMTTLRALKKFSLNSWHGVVFFDPGIHGTVLALLALDEQRVR